MRNILLNLYIISILLSFNVFADLSDNFLVPKEEMAFAKHYLNEIRIKNFDYVKKHLDAELINKVSDAKLEEISDYFREGKLLTTELIGSQVNTFETTWQGNFTFEYEFESGRSLANVVMKRVNDKTTIIGFNVYQTAASQKEIHKFELSGKSFYHYVVLVLACIVPIFILFTLVICIKTPIPKRKWLWVIFVLGGIGSVSLNWTNGAYAFKILEYQLFGAGAVAASEYAALIISAGFPLGAIFFWYKKKSFIELSKANKLINKD